MPLKLGFLGPVAAEAEAVVAVEPRAAVLVAGGEKAGVTVAGTGHSLVEVQRCGAVTIGVVNGLITRGIGHNGFTWGKYQD